MSTCTGATSHLFTLNAITTTVPTAPTSPSATPASSSQINLSWTASTTGGVTYSVYRSTISGFTAASGNLDSSGLTAPSYSDMGLMRSPLSAHAIDLIEAGGHYQEHCAVCHGDDGSGNPKFHGIMYPRPTDLRSKETQEMSDGELYRVIKNGVRWSGMPAFGKTGDDDEHAWKMVAYVRHLPKLTPAEKQKVLTRAEEPMDHSEAPHDHSH